jgi:hypothetical protein
MQTDQVGSWKEQDAMEEHVVHTGIPLYTMYTHRITGSVVEGSVEVQIPVIPVGYR